MNYSIFVTRSIPEAGIEVLKKSCASVDINQHDRVLSKSELIEKVTGRTGVLCTISDTIDVEIMNAASNVKGFANYGVGYNNIDVVAATVRNIMVSNTPGVLTDATADLAWALLFAAARRIAESDAYFRKGAWKGWGPMQFLGADITGKTLGIAGAGRIGENMALKSKGFGMTVLYASRHENTRMEQELGARRVALEELLKKSDFISLHVPLTDKTRHYIVPREFGLMKPSAILINTSRGPVIDETALVKTLREKRIAAAGLDVYEDEPMPKPGLTDLANVVCAPHLGSATQETRTRMAVMAAENLIAMIQGKVPPNLVNPEVVPRFPEGGPH